MFVHSTAAARFSCPPTPPRLWPGRALSPGGGGKAAGGAACACACACACARAFILLPWAHVWLGTLMPEYLPTPPQLARAHRSRGSRKAHPPWARGPGEAEDGAGPPHRCPIVPLYTCSLSWHCPGADNTPAACSRPRLTRSVKQAVNEAVPGLGSAPPWDFRLR
jgi:hypothetical protein